MTHKYKLLLPGLLSMTLLMPIAMAKTSTQPTQAHQNGSHSLLDDNGFVLELSASQQLFADNRMMYTVSFTNTGIKASDDIDITSPVPPDTVYVANTANGENCDILFSVDDGESWGQANQLEVQRADGSWRAATARDYTHIKWLYLSELRPAEVQQVSFQVTIE